MAPKPKAAPPPPADPQDQYVTIELPPGMTAEDLLESAPADERVEGESEEEPEPEAAPVARAAPLASPAARRPAVRPEPEPAPAPTPARRSEATRKAVVPLPELLKSRDRVALLAGDNARLKSENYRLRAAAIQQRMVEQARVDPVTITPQDRKILGDIAAAESDIGKVQIQTAEFLANKFNGVRQAEASRRTVNSEQQRLADSEEAMREQHRRDKVAEEWDYDSVGTKSGIFRAFTMDERTGTYYEPATVADIKAAPNPAQRAYELGLIRLREMGWAPDGDDAESAEAEVAEEEAAPAAKARGKKDSAAAASTVEARRPSAAEVDAAERRGERRGAAAIVDRAAERGRGIRHLPSAGGGPAQVQVTAAYLDTLKDRDPDKWLDILQRNPGLEYQYMSGSLS